ncbi:MAG: iron ABC transporter permease [Clostridiales bacterium]|nr:iron ABC transporter permease [Clostridiales bacterium]
MDRSRRIFILSIPLLLLCAILSIIIGPSGVLSIDMLRAMLAGETALPAWRILMYVRIPRTLAAIIAGSALAGSGLILQSVLRNPLASPGVIGVNSGAGLGAMLFTALLPGMWGAAPVAAFLGACLSVMAVYLLARLTDASRMTLVLSGVAVNSLLGACMDAIVTLIPDAALARSVFAIGGFSGVTMDKLLFALPFWCLGLLPPVIFRREIEIMTLGDEVAHGLGMHVERWRLIFLLCAALLSGAAVSFAGLIGFVGLIVPHMARRILKNDGRLLMPFTLVSGGILCLVCDVVARTLFAPYELPVGVVLSFLGAPFFIFLLINRKRSNRHDSV